MKLNDLYEWMFDQEELGATRDSGWDELRDLYIKANPECACCGSKKKLQVHHVQPVSDFPELEMEWSNLITLCTGGRFKSLNCHLIIGHRGDWQLWNPLVREDAARMKDRLTTNRDRKKY